MSSDYLFSLDHHRLGARTDRGFGLRPLPALTFWGFGFFCLCCFSPLSVWMIVTFGWRLGWLWFFPFGSAGLRLKIRLWFSDTRAGGMTLAERGPL